MQEVDYLQMTSFIGFKNCCSLL